MNAFHALKLISLRFIPGPVIAPIHAFHNAWLGLVVGFTLSLNTIIAVSIGGTVPVLLKRFKVDPAVASGPILTTITDMCGVFLLLASAAVMLPYLTGSA